MTKLRALRYWYVFTIQGHRIAIGDILKGGPPQAKSVGGAPGGDLLSDHSQKKKKVKSSATHLATEVVVQSQGLSVNPPGPLANASPNSFPSSMVLHLTQKWARAALHVSSLQQCSRCDVTASKAHLAPPCSQAGDAGSGGLLRETSHGRALLHRGRPWACASPRGLQILQELLCCSLLLRLG